MGITVVSCWGWVKTKSGGGWPWYCRGGQEGGEEVFVVVGTTRRWGVEQVLKIATGVLTLTGLPFDRKKIRSKLEHLRHHHVSV